MMSGGWAAGSVAPTTVIDEEVPFLASEHLQVKRGGATFKKGSGEDDGQGRSVIKAGTFVGPTDDGYYAADGDESADTSGFLMNSINVASTDVTAGVLIHGSVLDARVDVSDDAKDAVKGRITFQ